MCSRGVFDYRKTLHVTPHFATVALPAHLLRDHVSVRFEADIAVAEGLKLHGHLKGPAETEYFLGDVPCNK